MLNSRYVHLHEALGLGVMWLQRNARLIHGVDTNRLPENNTPPAHNTYNSQPTSNPKPKPTTPATESVLSARLQALQRVGSKTLPQNLPSEPINQAVQNAPQKHAHDWQQQLSGSILHVKVMVLSVCASPDDVAAGKLFSGQDGVLLNKMLAAINLQEKDVFLNTWLKDLPDFNPKPPTETVQAALPRLQAEYVLAGKPILLLLGGFFEREDVQQAISQLGENVQSFTISHPLRIISDPSLKRAAWDTLQAMQAVL